MLTFVCNTCEKTYEAQVNGIGIIYLDDNKRLGLKSEDDDCESCLTEIRESIRQKREEIKASKKQI